MEKNRIEKLAKKDRYDEALAECEKLLAQSPHDLDIIRVRAYVFSRAGDYNNALQDRKTIFAGGGKSLNDYYLAANTALAMRDFVLASTWLKKVLSLGREQNEKWFESAVLFLMSYALMERGAYSDALSSLEEAINIDPDCAMPVPGVGYCTSEQLRKQIELRNNKKWGQNGF